MTKVIDTRGLSCPEPVLNTLETIKKLDKGEVEILVDTDTSKENIIRAVKSLRWDVKEIITQENFYKIKIKKA